MNRTIVGLKYKLTEIIEKEMLEFESNYSRIEIVK
ncbi:protein of unknown function [Candidatus Nitrosocaldus cavascurensis]|uniref:Uncharacterized protein n=1 Tax=Candidatus Nitrosocaldus cavascurensis TaxID=2058097 RepID=A0A2K5ATF7_9ARCH|nr:protein of unknown function [Candidatus Nitrosocaldus cavascurensis]